MIYVVTHKLIDITVPKGYQKILVGPLASKSPCPAGYITDATGDNITEKNASFCECTAMYWMWKNTHDQYLGLCHYRRFFEGYYFHPKSDKAYSIDTLNKKIRNYDCIVANRLYYGTAPGVTTKGQWENYHHASDLEVLREVVALSGLKYLNAFDEHLDSWFNWPCNMLYCSRKVYDEYCSWLFTVLFECEHRIDVSDYDTYQKRLFGFMAERLLRVWLLAEGAKVREVHMTQTDTEMKQRLKLVMSRAKWTLKSIGEGRSIV